MNINYKHLKKMRELSGLTQVQLGELLGLNLIPSTKNPDRFECPQISWIETGRAKTIDFEFAHKWALECFIDLFSETEILLTKRGLVSLLKIKEKYSKLTKSLGLKLFNSLKDVEDYPFFEDKQLISIDEYFELLEISGRYHKIIKIIHE